jgi:uncharacterized membrane protein
MIFVETKLEIRRPAAEVFAFVSDQTNAPLWQQGLHEVRRVTDGPIAVGTEHVFVRNFAGKRIESRNRFLSYDEAARFVEFEIPAGLITGTASYLVEPVATDTCQLTSRMKVRVSGLARLLTPVLGRLLKRDVIRDDLRLKKLLEEGGASAPE